MKVIALEEHFLTPPKPGEPVKNGPPPIHPGTMIGAPFLDAPGAALDMDDKRLTVMDANGITMQVLSLPFAQSFPAETAVAQCIEVNDYLAKALKRHPDRLAGFAAIPTAVPEACAAELERCVKELGMVGSLIGNRVDGKFLDEPCFEDFLAKCEELDVPIYLHPGLPPTEVTERCYTGDQFSEDVASVLNRYGLGWHVDVGVHMMHLIMSGVFDRHPRLQIILGHWGEMLPYFIDRFDNAMPAAFSGLQHDPSYYLRNNMYVTSSGINTPEVMEFCIRMLGADRIMYSADYPFASFEGSDKLLENPAVSLADREKFAYGNAERLLKLV